MSEHYDVVIHGAGVAGLALALALARQSTPRPPAILLLDRHDLSPQPEHHRPPASVDDFDSNVFALNHASKKFFQQLDVWPGDLSRRLFAYDKMYVWDAGGDGHIHFDADEVGAPALGYIVEKRVILDWLIVAMRKQSGVELHSGDALTAARETDDALEVSLASGRKIQTSLLVGADGARSRVRQLAGIATSGWSYQQHAVVATVATERSAAATAWQRFLPAGPLAFLPLQPPWSSIVWSVTERRAAVLCDMAETKFMQCLAADFQQRLGRVSAVGERRRLPLTLRHANSYVAPRITLVADAAHTVHPLAGQGLNMGLRDVAALAAQLRQAWRAQQDIGDRRILRAYERARKADNWLMQLSFDGLKRLFGNELTLPTLLRNAGLNMLEQMPLVKRVLARKAMG